MNTVATAEDRLRHAIISGALTPGERLSEIEICKEYGFGRGIVRAALARLAQAGFVSSQQRSGWKVAPISPIGLREILLGRRQLEPLLAEVNLAPAELVQLERMGDVQAALIAAHAASDQLALLRQHDRQIRSFLALQLKAPLLSGWLDNLWDKSERYLSFIEARGRAKLQVFDWSVFVDAMRDGRTDLARSSLAGMQEDFASFTQARFLELDVAIEAPAARKTAKAVKPTKAGPPTVLSLLRGGAGKEKT